MTIREYTTIYGSVICLDENILPDYAYNEEELKMDPEYDRDEARTERVQELLLDQTDIKISGVKFAFYPVTHDQAKDLMNYVEREHDEKEDRKMYYFVGIKVQQKNYPSLSPISLEKLSALDEKLRKKVKKLDKKLRKYFKTKALYFAQGDCSCC